MITLHPDVVLSGHRLEPVDGTVTVAGGRITAVGAPQTGSADVVDLPGTTLLPGFIDAHVHIALSDPALVVGRGITTARDLAWSPAEIWPLVERSRDEGFDGPRLLAAGQMLTVAGGYPTKAVWAPPGTGRVVRGPQDAELAVREQADAGACVIKVALNEAVGPTLGPEDLRAIVGAAHARGLKVSGHVTGIDQLNKALDAGVDELAHMLMSNEHIPNGTIARMVDQGTVIVPTLSCRFGSDQDTAVDNLRRFVAAGGRVVYGTDLGNEGPEPGIDDREIAAMAKAGMDGHQIIASGTVESARWLGLAGAGSIAPGMLADLVAVAGDPLEAAAGLTNVVAVWRGGRRIA